MQILLIGSDTSVTETIDEMLSSITEWTVETLLVSDINFLSDYSTDKKTYDTIVASLMDLPAKAIEAIESIESEYPDVPLLVLFHYNRLLLVEPLLDAGATGYLQLGLPETRLHEAVRKVARGERYVGFEAT